MSDDEKRAIALYERAKTLQAQRQYMPALRACQQSLALREDAEVRALCDRLVATVGPM